ncbi:MAG: zinc-dependent alcohol dehydrogenase family protein [Micromonosporaceae bacterium]|nr:zinc-dependent alcohol dehydrogenase family protein [Micromonosporaceae bacterium]
MRATVIYGPRDIRLDEVPDPAIQRPTDAIVRVTAACVCGSDLWAYRGIEETRRPHRIGHEFVGVVEAVGAEVRSVLPGDFVIAPFAISDGTCQHCRNGITTSCDRGGWWGARDADGLLADGGQGEAVRVPYADGTLVATPEAPEPALIPGLLALSDVMGTGHHAAVSARVTAGSTVVVVGDGAVGLCAILAARRLGAERIIAMSRHAPRQRVALGFGATDLVAERGEEGVARVMDLLGGAGADATLECVGTRESMLQAVDVTRPGGSVGYVGVPSGGAEFPIRTMFARNVNVAGGVAPVRAYLPDLLADVLKGQLDPGGVFDLVLPLTEVADAYAAMDSRTAIKVMLRT